MKHIQAHFYGPDDAEAKQRRLEAQRRAYAKAGITPPKPKKNRRGWT